MKSFDFGKDRACITSAHEASMLSTEVGGVLKWFIFHKVTGLRNVYPLNMQNNAIYFLKKLESFEKLRRSVRWSINDHSTFWYLNHTHTDRICEWPEVFSHFLPFWWRSVRPEVNEVCVLKTNLTLLSSFRYSQLTSRIWFKL